MNRRKSITLAILVVLLLTFAVSGTIAYITTKTDPVKNVFTPATVDTDIDEPGFIPGTSTQKETIKVVNNGNIPVFVRVAIVGNWVDEDGNIVKPWEGTVEYDKSTWTLKDGYYYYNTALAAQNTTDDTDKTSNLLENPIKTTSNDGLTLVVTVIHQSIQSEPTSAAEEAWGYVPGSTSSN